MFSYSRHEANLLLHDGYLYYETDGETVTRSGNETETSKLCRLPLDELQRKTEDEGETVLDSLYRIEEIKGSKIYYYSASDGGSSKNTRHDFSVLHEYDAASGKDTVVYDYSSWKEYIWKYVAVTDNYLVLKIHRNSDIPLSEGSDFTMGRVIIDRKTGKYRPWKDYEDWENEAESDEEEKQSELEIPCQ